jgi:hypothetical protein
MRETHNENEATTNDKETTNKARKMLKTNTDYGLRKMDQRARVTRTVNTEPGITAEL